MGKTEEDHASEAANLIGVLMVRLVKRTYMHDTEKLVAMLRRAINGEFEVAQAETLHPAAEPKKSTELPFKEAKEEWLSTFERNYLLGLLQRNEGNISRAAREADIDRNYFRKLMRKYGIDGFPDHE